MSSNHVFSGVETRLRTFILALLGSSTWAQAFGPMTHGMSAYKASTTCAGWRGSIVYTGRRRMW